MEQTPYPGQYYDGNSAENRPVRVIPAPHGVAIVLSDETQLWWPFEQTKLHRTGNTLTFRKGEPIGETLVMEDPAFLAELRKLNPGVADGKPAGENDVFFQLLGYGLLAILILVLIVRWGFPLVGDVLANLMPVKVEQEIGKAALSFLVPKAGLCVDPSVERIVARLKDTAPDSRYDLHVYVAEDPVVNAFALPGGYIVIFRGLINKTANPEETAAVLAHEMQHVWKRHSARGMMRGLSIWVAVNLVTGGGDIASIAGTLGALHYQRGDEEEADAAGLRLLEDAHVDPKAMVSMLELLDKLQGDAPSTLKYISTHPLTKERIDRMRKLAANYRGNDRELLPGQKWPPSVAQCKSTPTPR